MYAINATIPANTENFGATPLKNAPKVPSKKAKQGAQ